MHLDIETNRNRINLGDNVTLVTILIILISLFLSFSVFMSWRRRKFAKITRKMKMSGETFILGPEMASFRGATAKYGRVKNDGVIGLTNERIIFVPFVGQPKKIPLVDINNVSESKRFLGHYRAGVTVMVLHANEMDIGFFVKDLNKWRDVIKGIIFKGGKGEYF